MRILITTPVLPYAEATNAGALVMYEQIRGVAARHKVTLATFAGPEAEEREAIRALQRIGIRVHAVWRPGYHGWGLWRRRAQVAGYASRSWYRWVRGEYPKLVVHTREPEMQALLNRLSTLEPFDIVHVNDSSMASYQLPRRAPRILSELEVRGYGEAADNDAEARRWQRYLPRAWRQFDRVQVLTGQDAAALGTMAQDVIPRVRINPFGVRLPPSLALEEQPGEVVFVGGFNHPPNVDAARWMVHDIMPQVRTQVSEVRLTLVGKDPPEEVRALAGTDVAVTGRVPSVEPYLRRAAVILAPLRTGGGMRMKVLQAMAFGKPVVTTPLGAEGLVGERDELPVVVGRDASQLAWETARLLTDEVARRDLGQRARAFVAEHHTWEAYLNRLEGTYQELASSRAST